MAPHITGLVLAGGRGSRMGGLDKGLQHLRGRPLVQHAIDRLQPQVGALLVNANRNLDAYRALGLPVHPDPAPDFSGPLAGYLSGLLHCRTPWMVTVPCDCPFFPLNLVARLAAAARTSGADCAIAATPEPGGALLPHPVFCLLRRTLLPSLQEFIAAGGRQVAGWTRMQSTVTVAFPQEGEFDQAFLNVNSIDELAQLERS